MDSHVLVGHLGERDRRNSPFRKREHGAPYTQDRVLAARLNFINLSSSDQAQPSVEDRISHKLPDTPSSHCVASVPPTSHVLRSWIWKDARWLEPEGLWGGALDTSIGRGKEEQIQ